MKNHRDLRQLWRTDMKKETDEFEVFKEELCLPEPVLDWPSTAGRSSEGSGQYTLIGETRSAK